MLFWWHWLRVTIIILDFLLRVKFDFPLKVDFFFFFWMITQGQFLIFDSGSNFYSLDNDSRSRFIYVWLLVDDSRSRILIFFFFVRFEVKVNLWLVIQGQELILIKRWFAHLWGLNDWFWKLFFKVPMKICPWGNFSMKIFYC